MITITIYVFLHSIRQVRKYTSQVPLNASHTHTKYKLIEN